MGVSRLLTQKDRLQTAADLLDRYTGEYPALRPYYLEQLLQLDSLDLLSPSLSKFCAGFRPSPSAAMLNHMSETYEAVDADDRRNFERFVLEPLANLPVGPDNLMDMRFVPDQRDALIETIRTHLVDRRPLSFLRLGDGEAYAYSAPTMTGIDPALFATDNKTFERHWWGAAPPPEIREDIAARVRSAVASCDIVGLPSIFRIIRDLPTSQRRFGSSGAQRGLSVVLNACGGEIPLEGKIVTEERCHQVAFSKTVLAELASAASSVVIVSCWPPDQLSPPFPVSAHITVPPAQKLKRLVEDDAPPLFQVYPQILDQIREAVAPGTLVLIGAGIIGKFVAEEARKSGAVAIDVGSMLDYMAGSKTRGIADLI